MNVPAVEVRSGSKPEVTVGVSQVRSNPRSEHQAHPLACRLRAISGLMHRSNASSFDDFVGAGEQRRWHVKPESLSRF
jgi:hypothetical protein